MPSIDPDALHTRRDSGTFLKKSTATLRRYEKAGQLTPIRLGTACATAKDSKDHRVVHYRGAELIKLIQHDAMADPTSALDALRALNFGRTEADELITMIQRDVEGRDARSKKVRNYGRVVELLRTVAGALEEQRPALPNDVQA
ncbi:MAG TPA: hypothetical protein VJ890_21620 [Vineibacter sp.]|nr:hypothetical protein [Vineibacter sp.]